MLIRFVGLLTAAVLFCFTESGAQTGTRGAGAEAADIPTFVEDMPKFDGSLNEWLASNLRYPDSAQAHNEEGRVVVRYVIDERGLVSDVRLVQSVSPDLDAEALRVVRAMPPWRPGMQNGRPTKVWYTLPIRFQLDDSKPEKK